MGFIPTAFTEYISLFNFKLRSKVCDNKFIEKIMMSHFFKAIFLAFVMCRETKALFPRASETRELVSLDGIWNFRLSPADPEYGFKHMWFKDDLIMTGSVIPMPVPASYNDITQDAAIRDHVGFVWYDRRFFIPDTWGVANSRVWLRFGSVHYAAQVWINGYPAMDHKIGHLPFEKDITKYIKFGENLITVACDNTLLNDTIPQGDVVEIPIENGMKLEQQYSFDFFNYAGIHRSVFLYTTPQTYISDIAIKTAIKGTDGIIVFDVYYGGDSRIDEVSCHINIRDKNKTIVAQASGFSGTLTLMNAHLWWPYLMHPDPGYLYTFEAHLETDSGRKTDIYRQKFGIRKISWSNTSLFINNKVAYLKGFGRHEDSNIRGKGLDLALAVKDYNLIKWIGANTYRTSHYPYAEELYDMADEQGIMIIDECPSVDTVTNSDSLLINHKRSLTELISRDKNHPSVIMWSIANEPRTQYTSSDDYFSEIVDHVKSMDISRPVTIALNQPYFIDVAAQHLDIISFNRYNSWYSQTGHLEVITENVISEAMAWHTKHNKPVLMSEYGSDTLSGLHLLPAAVWSEEYQTQLLSNHFKAFDTLRKMNFFIGEFIWNFADFKTAQTVGRAGGNKKGIFTREREPKASAHILRMRYHLLAQETDGVPLPYDLFPYLAPTYIHDKSEL